MRSCPGLRREFGGHVGGDARESQHLNVEPLTRRARRFKIALGKVLHTRCEARRVTVSFTT